jgi:uncharacterized protein YbjT (DUF2867 family)
MRVLVTGGKGELGRRVVPRLVAAGHEVLVGTRTPRPRADEVTEVAYAFGSDEPLVPLVNGVDTIVHLATQPASRSADVQATEQLLRAATDTGVGHLLYVSIVGIDDHPFPYYRTKLAVERVIADGPVPWTIFRTTQFHTLVGRFADVLRRPPVVVVPRDVPFQPIDGEVVADRVAELVAAGPSGRVRGMGGPDVLDLAEAVRSWLRAEGYRRPVVALRLPGRIGAAFRRGDILAVGDEAGGSSFEEHLADVVPRRREPVAAALALTGVTYLALAAWMGLAPGSFVAAIAGFGPGAEHFVRDLATFAAPIGVALVLAASRPAWRGPVVGLALLQNGLHLVNHLVDVGAAEPAWHGPVNLVMLAGLQVWLAVLWRAARRRAASPSRPASQVRAAA